MMMDIFTLQLVLVFFVTASSALIVFSVLPAWRKYVALLLFVSLIVTGYVSIVELLGRPKPSRLATIVSENASATVVAAHSIENKAIYIWLLRDGTIQPIAYELPWSLETAKKLRNAQTLAKTRGGNVRMSVNKNRGMAEGEWVFHAAPVEKLPAKRAQG